MKKVNLNEKFDLIKELWSPKIIGELNGQDVKLAKVKGEFVWHNHTNEDELFLIVKGSLKIDLEGESITLDEGEMLVIPRGVEHRPVAEEEAWILLFEPQSTKHTGEVKSELTVDKFEKI
ncbi:mannose-6-phosphate isomerase-like protein (cupin superfamily) [Algoriphagus sp. 4150]|uniref:cupin domain-containing protein n=1 Tax=Algoriphagus sp. 4150 TaxID=2817756 RepID=UPI002865F016|nr:cupin domain-containing protein [Algoriphagus sp. 4150]MDR7131554.1 mannose-6-phosphate isomerase-like protein (cupin superfamily) [Algoriphagus sp. 4150]